ncbi:SDR family oxidoreductase [Vreelandella jeotgali]|uniref:SDR family oxidoreductase n=1 Tax=Vreelandella jeotgali TaxID=553386 RepID=UPI00034924DC|nr:SDR family oxidoreductase [Halomonas jeotgali]
MKPSVLIIGCGDLGTTLGRELVARGHSVTGVRRHADALAGTGIEPLALDLNALDHAGADALPEADYVIYTVSADRFEESAYQSAYRDGLQRVLAVLQQHANPPRQVLFVSSTSVYGQQDGEVINEQSPTSASSFSGRLMREAEQSLLDHPLPGTVVRFSGIYGPGRDRLIRQVAEGRVAAVTPEIYTNRIHRDDCTGILDFLIQRRERGEHIEPLYLCSDSEPATKHEVMAWLARQLRVEATETLQTPLRRRTNKRCDNTRIVESGYRFRYPDFREGYTQVLQVGGFLPEQSDEQTP